MFSRALVVFGLTLCFCALIEGGWPWKKSPPSFDPETFEIKNNLGRESFLYYAILLGDLIDRAPFVKSDDLVELDKAASMIYQGKLHNPHPTNKNFMNALRLFQTLKTVGDGNKQKCNKRSYQVIYNNYLAAFGDEHMGYQEKLAHKKINKAIARLRHFHAENLCKGVYLPKWETLSKTIEPAHLKLAEYLLEQVIAYHKPDEAQEILSSSTKLFQFTHDYEMTFRIVNHCPLILKILNEMAKDDPDVKYLLPVLEKGRFEVNGDKLRQICYKYLLNPCKHVYNGLEDVFKPAEMDIELTNDIREDRLDYHKAWAAWDACKRVHDSQLTIIYHIEDYLNQTYNLAIRQTYLY